MTNVALGPDFKVMTLSDQLTLHHLGS